MQTQGHREAMIGASSIPKNSDSLSERINMAARAIDMWHGGRALSVAMKTLPHMGVHLAGGAVRDILRGTNSIKDFDIFITGEDFNEFVNCLAQVGNLEYGPFGSPRWLPHDHAAYADIISVNHFENGVERCYHIEDALRQFDFTANAVAIDLRTFALHNPIGGLEDAQQGVMRGVRYDYPDEPIAPGQNLSRNQVLWLRIVHYSNALNLKPEEITRKWLKNNQYCADAVIEFSKKFFHPIMRFEF